jgi:hypothetical protein
MPHVRPSVTSAQSVVALARMRYESPDLAIALHKYLGLGHSIRFCLELPPG